MKKFLAAFDGLKFSPGTSEYAIKLAKQTGAHLVGIFLEDHAYHSYSIADLVSGEEGGLYNRRRHLDKKDEKKRAVAVAGFDSACRQAGIAFNIHKDRSTAIRELVTESIYADLAVIDRGENFSRAHEQVPSRFIQELLPDIQCPILLVSRSFKPFDKLIMLYDGEPSSVFAIRMLSYVLEGAPVLPVEVVTVIPGGKKKNGPGRKLMKEFLERHFPAAGFTDLKGIPEIEIVKYLGTQKGHPLVALGAYRRSKVSRWFRASMADTLMKELKFPLFIAHNR